MDHAFEIPFPSAVGNSVDQGSPGGPRTVRGITGLRGYAKEQTIITLSSGNEGRLYLQYIRFYSHTALKRVRRAVDDPKVLGMGSRL